MYKLFVSKETTLRNLRRPINNIHLTVKQLTITRLNQRYYHTHQNQIKQKGKMKLGITNELLESIQDNDKRHHNLKKDRCNIFG